MINAGVLQPNGIEHPTGCFKYAVSGIAQAWRPGGAFKADGTGIPVGETFDTGVFFTEPNAPGQQYQWCLKVKAAEVDIESGVLACVHIISGKSIMFNVILYQPEIPPNTGNIIRLCANTGCRLHLIRPLAFELDDKRLRRAGLDYHEYASVRQYDALSEALKLYPQARLYAFSTKGGDSHASVHYAPGDILLFGSETCGLPDSVLRSLEPEQRLRVPMLPGQRSLNLSNAAAIVVYEAWRQQGFAGAG